MKTDFFTKRADMYYRKRLDLLHIIEDFYRAHRSLAKKYDQVKLDSDDRLLNPWTSCPLSLSRYHQTSEFAKDSSEKTYDTYSESFDFDHYQDSGESEVDDPEHEHEDLSEAKKDETMKLREELERQNEENKLQKQLLVEKDEEKREAIRQLSFFTNSLKEEKVNLQKKNCERFFE